MPFFAEISNVLRALTSMSKINANCIEFLMSSENAVGSKQCSEKSLYKFLEIFSRTKANESFSLSMGKKITQ